MKCCKCCCGCRKLTPPAGIILLWRLITGKGWRCPRCNCPLYYKQEFCDCCGQEINWKTICKCGGTIKILNYKNVIGFECQKCFNIYFDKKIKERRK